MQNTISTRFSCKKKILMWSKVNNLNSEHLNISQIAFELKMSRTTVRKYLSMSFDEFRRSESYQRRYKSKLDKYESFIKNKLDDHSYFSSSQIFDHLQEHFPDFPNVCYKTVYNYVQQVRSKFNLPKRYKTNQRNYNKIPESPLGKNAQVDFGEKWIYDSSNKAHKVYFFAIVLCRSRYKFIYFSNRPFTTALAIYAHELAFEYFGGIPQKIIYDQDKVFLHNENLGDYILTHDFNRFVKEYQFSPHFCMKYDPQSKGKIENVVKYVKYNFLRGRTYVSIDQLNSECLSWLSRTANGKEHAGIKQIPSVLFKEEQKALTPYSGIPCNPSENIKEYIIRKDNTVCIKSSFYSLPIGSYSSKTKTCFVEEKSNNIINIYSIETGKLITSHTKALMRGQHVSKTVHRYIKTTEIAETEQSILKYLGEHSVVSEYMNHIRQTKKRYYRDNLTYMFKHMNKCSANILLECLILCNLNHIYNMKELIEITLSKQKLMKYEVDIQHNIDTFPKCSDYTFNPEKATLKTYEDLML